MNKEFDELEKEMINFNFADIQKDVNDAKASFAASAFPASNKLCDVWRKIRRFIKPLSHLPVVGKFVAILVEVLDSICPSN